jgi:magnesium transporter
MKFIPKIPKIPNIPSFTKSSRSAGAPPGTLVHIGKTRTEKPEIQHIQFGVDFSKTEVVDHDQLKAPETGTPDNHWFNIFGVHDEAAIRQIGNLFGIHVLLLEDVMDTQHRPKLEVIDNKVFLSLKMLKVDEEKDKIGSEQLTIIYCDNWLWTFQEVVGDIFDNLRNRIKTPESAIRQKGLDYLFYRTIDTAVDHYFNVLEYISFKVEDLEEEILSGGDAELKDIQILRRELLVLRKAIVPLRDCILQLSRNEPAIFGDHMRPYFRDLYEHIIQIYEATELQRDLVSSQMDLFLSEASNQMNKVMQVLTIIATLFIPLTFVAGVYGMNFKHMPEIEWEYGYHFAWAIMLTMSAGLLYYFRRKKWL